MSDYSTRAFSVPVVHEPNRPSLKKMTETLGNPPWTVEVDDYSALPDECTGLVGTIVWRGVRFKRVRDRDWDEVDCHD